VDNIYNIVKAAKGLESYGIFGKSLDKYKINALREIHSFEPIFHRRESCSSNKFGEW